MILIGWFLGFVPLDPIYDTIEQLNVDLTPLASFNCTGMAFRGGYFLSQLLQLQLLLLRCALRYTMAHWS